MAQIAVITTALKGTAQKMGTTIETIRTSQAYITKTALNGIEEFFSGTLPNVMLDFLLAKKDVYEKMIEALEEYKQAIESSADTYEASEEQLTAWAEVLGEQGVQVPLPRPEGGWDASGSWDTVGPSFPNRRPDINSDAYNISVSKVRVNTRTLINKNDNKEHINCPYYARARFLEVNQLDQYPYDIYNTDGNPEAIKASNCVVWFSGSSGPHAVYVEYYDEQNNTVYFSDSNVSSHEDGKLQAMSYDNFLTLGGGWKFKNVENIPA